MGSTARTIGGLDGTAHCQYPRSCCIPAVCCMYKLPAIGNYFMYVACKIWLTLFVIIYVCHCPFLVFVFLCMMEVLHGASVCPSASEHDAFK